MLRRHVVSSFSRLTSYSSVGYMAPSFKTRTAKWGEYFFSEIQERFLNLGKYTWNKD